MGRCWGREVTLSSAWIWNSSYSPNVLDTLGEVVSVENFLFPLFF